MSKHDSDAVTFSWLNREVHCLQEKKEEESKFKAFMGKPRSLRD